MHQSDIRVVIADERFLFRKGVRALLGQAVGIQVVEEASSAKDVLGAVETHAPDLLLLDSALSGAGLELVRAVRRVQPRTRVFLMLGSGNAQPAELVDEMGVTACVAKDSASQELVPAIRKLTSVRGSCALNPATIHEVIDVCGGISRRALTRREQQVLDRLMRGETSREIAEALGLSLKTIDAHKFNLMRKLDVHNRSDLIKLAIRQQISSYASDDTTS